METLSAVLRDVRLMSTGLDGGHLYIRGTTAFGAEDSAPTFTYFRDRATEEEFEAQFTGKSVDVTTSRWEHIPGVGLSLYDIDWRPLNHPLH